MSKEELEEVLERILEEHGRIRAVEFYCRTTLAYLRGGVHDAAVVQQLVKLAYELGRRLGKKAGGAGGVIEDLAFAAYAWLAMRGRRLDPSPS